MGPSPEAQRGRLLEFYLRHGESYGRALERTALRSESVHMRDILAYGATQGGLNSEQLAKSLLQETDVSQTLDPGWLGTLASVVALQNLQDGDTEFAILALEKSLPQLKSSPSEYNRLNKLYTELLFEEQRFAELDQHLDKHPWLSHYFYGYLATDGRSPFIRSRRDAHPLQRWQWGFNLQFRANNLASITLRQGSEVPFNRMETPTFSGPRTQEPLVTVIMTTFNPTREDVLQSARSILSQSWQAIELLIVDDASSAEYAPILNELAALDSRVEVIRLGTNGGTYVARNVGIERAAGEFITGQDADDWSHPQRIETQVNHLLRNSACPGNQVYTVNMTEDLVRIRRGYHPFIPSAPTLMVRTGILREVGGYLPARKAADNELRGRVAAYAGFPIHHIKDPLIFMRILPDSLSRADFRAGWQHPARRSFWSAYKTWHTEAPKDDLRLRHGPQGRLPVHIPPRFTEAPKEPQRLDIVFAADWCATGQRQAQMFEEITQLTETGKSVGVLHLENALHLSRTTRTYYEPIQALISSGSVTEVLADEQFHDVEVLVVRAPEVLQFMPTGNTAFSANRITIIADKPPTDQSGERVLYIPEDCSAHAEVFFGQRPTWVPAGETIRKQLLGHLPEGQVMDGDYPLAFDAGRWKVRRDRLRNTRPVIGRWSGDVPSAWTSDAEEISQIWPTDGSADVRLYGQPDTALQALGLKRLPATWVAFDEGHITRRTYYGSLDFFVYFPQPGHREGHEMAILEAMAAGCVVILPPEFGPSFGVAAIYAEASQVPAQIERYAGDWELFRHQSAQGIYYARTRSDTDFVHTMTQLVQDSHHTQEAAAR
ncbi:glycosyltransferase [Nesterenkonia salmonea]|uniref:Glycosyltransferase n=1 Tax=Nesterenkonia salmonea TaxID=1804987 RepID=A0A5R9B8R5_9MICC|nr:glycosyltransferase [Nesterenkonia salmonea]TLP93049.1 glycosyltransferase [Nesterenkonia salmonea]